VKGIIKKWFRYHGFGFIEPEGGDEKIFCPRSERKYDVGTRPEEVSQLN
jgi:cold shock CspA family protein